jgi:hypothetical protein
VGFEGFWTVETTPDGQAYCYDYARGTNALYVVDGVN